MKTILLIEDEFDIADAIVGALRNAGYQVISCGDPRDAVKRLKETRADLVITDLMMPYASGYEVTMAVRDTEGFEKTPVLLMSCIQPTAQQGHFKWDRFLRKPFDLNELLASVEKLIGRPDARPGGFLS